MTDANGWETTAPAPNEAPARAALADIAQRDPAFDLDLFLAEAQQAFWLLGRAYAECNPALCQAVLSADLTAREQATIESGCRAGTTRAPRPDDASSARLVSVASDAFDDTIVVHFSSSWSPHAVPTAEDQRDRRHHPPPPMPMPMPMPEEREQQWCFQRAAGSRTVRSSAGARCTNCGALVEASRGSCRYCGASIAAGGGWRVIRIDDVEKSRTGDADAALQQLIGWWSVTPGTAQADASAGSPRRRGGPRRLARWIGRLITLVLMLGVAAFIGAGVSGPYHRAVVKVLPILKHPELSGPLDLDGDLQAQQLSASFSGQPFVFRGSCSTFAAKTSWAFTAKLPDGSTFEMHVSLPPGHGGPGTYGPPALKLSAKADNDLQVVFYGLDPTAPGVSLVIDAAGAGDLTFAGLIPSNGNANLSGHISWSCMLR